MFYPKGLAQAKELEYASSHLTSIEGSTPASTARRSPRAFASGRRPCPTALYFRSKDRALPLTAACSRKPATRSNDLLNSGVLELRDRLGPMLWQFAPTKKFDAADFGKFLELLPTKADGRALRHVVEVRHPSQLVPDFVALARSFNTPVVFTDHARYPSLADATGDFLFCAAAAGQGPDTDRLSAKRTRRLVKAFAPLGARQGTGRFAVCRSGGHGGQARPARRLCLRYS